MRLSKFHHGKHKELKAAVYFHIVAQNNQIILYGHKFCDVNIAHIFNYLKTLQSRYNYPQFCGDRLRAMMKLTR